MNALAQLQASGIQLCLCPVLLETKLGNPSTARGVTAAACLYPCLADGLGERPTPAPKQEQAGSASPMHHILKPFQSPAPSAGKKLASACQEGERHRRSQRVDVK